MLKKLMVGDGGSGEVRSHARLLINVAYPSPDSESQVIESQSLLFSFLLLLHCDGWQLLLLQV